ncbi:hypothetical protein [Kibdelosporangium philippinense]|uniref:NHL domain-containing protein n=1 Tax=Kibdelosporangium philippinense TaxID=211113 RepID=UPI0035EBC4DD
MAGNGRDTGPSGDGGPATNAVLDTPSGIARDAAGNVYVTEWWTPRVRKIAPNGTITTFAGTGEPGSGPDGGQATATQLRAPVGLAVDRQGNVYIADELDHKVRKVAPNGIITTAAGTREAGFGGDNADATKARPNGPTGIAVDKDSKLYIADTNNNRVRQVDGTKVIRTVVGDGVAGSGAGQLDHPRGAAADTEQAIYAADTGNNRITVTNSFAVGGNPGSGWNQFDHPAGIAMGPGGTVYVADTNNHRK